jgi:hypothetical protein
MDRRVIRTLIFILASSVLMAVYVNRITAAVYGVIALLYLWVFTSNKYKTLYEDLKACKATNDHSSTPIHHLKSLV